MTKTGNDCMRNINVKSFMSGHEFFGDIVLRLSDAV